MRKIYEVKEGRKKVGMVRIANAVFDNKSDAFNFLRFYIKGLKTKNKKDYYVEHEINGKIDTIIATYGLEELHFQVVESEVND